MKIYKGNTHWNKIRNKLAKQKEEINSDLSKKEKDAAYRGIAISRTMASQPLANP